MLPSSRKGNTKVHPPRKIAVIVNYSSYSQNMWSFVGRTVEYCVHAIHPSVSWRFSPVHPSSTIAPLPGIWEQ
jgi:hypothetical protein